MKFWAQILFTCFCVLFLRTFSLFFTDVPSAKIFVDSPVCYGSRSTIKSEISPTTRPEKIKWQKSKDGIDFHYTENPIHSLSTANFTSPSYVTPKTTFTDKLYYRFLIWNENGEGVSNTVYLYVTESMALFQVHLSYCFRFSFL